MITILKQIKYLAILPLSVGWRLAVEKFANLLQQLEVLLLPSSLAGEKRSIYNATQLS